METWEEIALWLACQAGISTPEHRLVEVQAKQSCCRADLIVIATSGARELLQAD
ncbi:hypothetical protein D9M72_616970 [compost metagenome]